eukprot:225729-Rhodomonas_salina.3
MAINRFTAQCEPRVQLLAFDFAVWQHPSFLLMSACLKPPHPSTAPPGLLGSHQDGLSAHCSQTRPAGQLPFMLAGTPSMLSMSPYMLASPPSMVTAPSFMLTETPSTEPASLVRVLTFCVAIARSDIPSIPSRTRRAEGLLSSLTTYRTKHRSESASIPYMVKVLM